MIKYPPVDWNKNYDNFTSKEDWEIADKFYNKKIELFKKAKLIKKIHNGKVRIIVGYLYEDEFTFFLKSLNTDEIIIKKINKGELYKDYDLIFLDYQNIYIENLENAVFYNCENSTIGKSLNFIKSFNDNNLIICIYFKKKSVNFKIQLFILISKQYKKLK